MSPAARIAALRAQLGGDTPLITANDGRAVDNSAARLYDYRDPAFLRSSDSFDHFHLGGIHLGGEPLPGVTDGSMLVSVHGDDTNNIMFCGRSLSQHVNYLQRLDREGLDNYRACLKQLIDNAESYTRFPAKKVSTMHFISADSPHAFYIDTPKAVLKGAEELLRGETGRDMPVKYCGRALKMHMAGAAILYDPAKL